MTDLQAFNYDEDLNRNLAKEMEDFFYPEEEFAKHLEDQYWTQAQIDFAEWLEDNYLEANLDTWIQYTEYLEDEAVSHWERMAEGDY